MASNRGAAPKSYRAGRLNKARNPPAQPALDPNAAAFSPPPYQAGGMNYNDLMFYNYAMVQNGHQELNPYAPAFPPTAFQGYNDVNGAGYGVEYYHETRVEYNNVPADGYYYEDPAEFGYSTSAEQGAFGNGRGTGGRGRGSGRGRGGKSRGMNRKQRNDDGASEARAVGNSAAEYPAQNESIKSGSERNTTEKSARNTERNRRAEKNSERKITENSARNLMSIGGALKADERKTSEKSARNTERNDGVVRNGQREVTSARERIGDYSDDVRAVVGACGRGRSANRQGRSGGYENRPGRRDNENRPGRRDTENRPGRSDKENRPGRSDKENRPGSGDNDNRSGRRDNENRPGRRDDDYRPGRRDNENRPGSGDNDNRSGRYAPDQNCPGAESSLQSNVRADNSRKSKPDKGNQNDEKPYGRVTNKSVFKFRPNGPSEELETQRERLVEHLMTNSYECMICCDVIRKEVAVWSCGECYNVFHLFCIKKWAKSPCAVVGGTDMGWRCPGCQNVTLKVPNQYLCFCSKQRDPEVSPYETPHSCGEVCGKNRGGVCQHPCNILCHPGPCPPCNAQVVVTCSCAKTSRTMTCRRAADARCDQPCGTMLNCGKHECQEICHSGRCSTCSERYHQYCYCGKALRSIVCGSAESLQEKYGCGEVCGRKLECGEHECMKLCHDGDCDSCELAPDKVRFCSCGKTELTEISAKRESCTDPIPTCDKICDKELLCGPPSKRHRCSAVCHQGPCRMCEDGVTPVSCRCQATVKEMSCQEAEEYLTGDALLCNRRCNKKRQCGKHKCQLPCCVEQEHSCSQQCGRKLSCGLHRCELPCHRGTCESCWNVCFEEVTCHCGASVLDPPVACGVKPPECRQSCQRRHDCDHPIRHSCHNEEQCPPCTELTKKMCMGEHEMRHNIPCHITDISCGLPCGRGLPCKQHRCAKTCHKGDCLAEEDACEQRCRKARPSCDHICAVPCHPGVPCPETQCEAKIEVKCSCGNRSELSICGAGKKDGPGKYPPVTNASMIGKLIYFGNGQTVDLNSLNASKGQLECNEECAKLERNRRLALALQIENPDLGDKLGTPTYNDFLKDFARANPAFVADIERVLAELVQNAKSSTYANRRHSFQPMKREQRRFIHEIAAFYGCKTQSYDFEPVKSVTAVAYKGKCWMPNMTLTACIKRETSAPLPIPHHSTEKEIRAKSAATKQSTTSLQPSENASKTKDVSKPKFVDYFDFDEELD